MPQPPNTMFAGVLAWTEREVQHKHQDVASAEHDVRQIQGQIQGLAEQLRRAISYRDECAGRLDWWLAYRATLLSDPRAKEAGR